jgi:hypothetical protein
MLILTSSQPGTHEHFYRYSPCRRETRFACASFPEQGLSLIFLQNALQHDVTAKEQQPCDVLYKHTEDYYINALMHEGIFIWPHV